MLLSLCRSVIRHVLSISFFSSFSLCLYVSVSLSLPRLFSFRLSHFRSYWLGSYCNCICVFASCLSLSFGVFCPSSLTFRPPHHSINLSLVLSSSQQSKINSIHTVRTRCILFFVLIQSSSPSLTPPVHSAGFIQHNLSFPKFHGVQIVQFSLSAHSLLSHRSILSSILLSFSNFCFGCLPTYHLAFISLFAHIFFAY